MDERSIFYWEWVPLPKAEFNILAMLAEQGGSFSGNYSDICRYLGVTPQDRNRQPIRAAVEDLTANGWISHTSRGRTQHLSVIPKATEISLPRRWVQSVIRHDYSGKSVSFAVVLKVFIWIVHNKQDVVTNDMIAQDLGVCVSTVVSGKNVLLKEYENITRKKVSEKLGDDFFRTIGQRLAAGVWWKDP